MPRLFRFFLIWLSCTVLTVSAVFLTVRFVLGSTAPLPPSAPGVTTVLALAAPTATLTPGPSGSIGAPTSTLTPTPDASPSASRPKPTSSTAPPSHPASPSHSARPPSYDCSGGAGAHSFETTGGQVVVRFGANAICLVSAVPALGFTTSTAQSAADILTVTFTGAHHRSELTATLHPQAQEATREVSW
ncbi:hypothetical protein [Streptacidiphilus sp. PAMC 29251]